MILVDFCPGIFRKFRLFPAALTEAQPRVPPITGPQGHCGNCMADDKLQSGYHGVIDVAFDGDKAVLTLNCGENRFNDSFLKKFHAALDKVLENKSAKALITTSQGKFYSNGLDLNWMGSVSKSDPARLVKFRDDLRDFLLRVLQFPLPTVSAINGHAFAMGAILSLLHDHIIMTTDRGWWSLNEVHIGLRFRPFLLAIIRERLAGSSTLVDAAILGRRFPGQEAKASGIVQEACPPEELLARSMDWIRRTVPKNGYDRDHFQAMKKDLYGHILALSSQPPVLQPAKL